MCDGDWGRTGLKNKGRVEKSFSESNEETSWTNCQKVWKPDGKFFQEFRSR